MVAMNTERVHTYEMFITVLGISQVGAKYISASIINRGGFKIPPIFIMLLG